VRPPENWQNARFTLGIAAVTAAVWLLTAVLGAEQWAFNWGGFIPARFGFGGDEALAPLWLTPLTATLIHAGLLHLGFNLLMHLFCGRPVETVIGPTGLITLYVAGAYAAAAAQFAVDPNNPTPMVGASGAISAIIGAYAMLFGRNKINVADPRLARALHALWLMAAWIVLQMVVGFAFVGGQIAVAAHIGGFIIGVILANPLLLLRYRGA